MEEPEGDAAEDEQRQHVGDRRDEGVCKDGRVDVDGLREDGDAATDDLGDDDGDGDRDGDGQRVVHGVIVAEDQPVDQLQLRKADDADRQSDEHGDAQLLPDHLQDIARPDLVQRHAADDGDRRLAARIAARAHDHRHAGDQNGRQHLLVDV